MKREFKNIETLFSYICDSCVKDLCCVKECPLLKKARKMCLEEINEKWIEYKGNIKQVAKYISEYKFGD